MTSTALQEKIVEAIQDKKGSQIVVLDLRKIDDAIADYYVICEASNSIQVKAIGENIVSEVKEKLGENPIGKEGFSVNEWVLVDFFNVVAHVFLTPIRGKYQLEDLWGDAIKVQYEDLF